MSIAVGSVDVERTTPKKKRPDAPREFFSFYVGASLDSVELCQGDTSVYIHLSPEAALALAALLRIAAREARRMKPRFR